MGLQTVPSRPVQVDISVLSVGTPSPAPMIAPRAGQAEERVRGGLSLAYIYSACFTLLVLWGEASSLSAVQASVHGPVKNACGGTEGTDSSPYFSVYSEIFTTLLLGATTPPHRCSVRHQEEGCLLGPQSQQLGAPMWASGLVIC